MKNLLILTTVLMLFSCSENKENVKIENITFFDVAEFTEGTIHDINYTFNSLVLLTPSTGTNTFFYVYSLKNNSFSEGFLNKGKGPNEILGTLSTGVIDSLIWAYDPSQRRICYINFFDHTKINSISLDFKNKNALSYLSIEHLAKDELLAANCDNSNSKIDILDNRGNVISQFGHYQNFSELEDNEVLPMKQAYGRSAMKEINSDKNKLCLLYRYSDIIEIYDLKSRELEFTNEGNNDFQAEYTNGKYMIQNENTTLATISTTSSKKYIYALFSGKPRFVNKAINKEAGSSDIVLVYNWRGKLIKKLKLDRAVKLICVSNDGDVLYSYDNETGAIIAAEI